MTIKIIISVVWIIAILSFAVVKILEFSHERFNRKLNQKFGEYDGLYNEQVEKKMSNFVVASKVIGNFLIRWRRRRLDRIKEKK